MAEFVQTMKDWRRMCKAYTTDNDSCCEGCPVVDFHEHGCGAIFEMEDSTDWKRYADTIKAWAAEHPEPVYPTWYEFMRENKIIPDVLEDCGDFYKSVGRFLVRTRIERDMAQKLELQPKEG